MTIRQVYEGSDGEATRALYARLKALGTAGTVAENLFRAHKCSSRAKDYRGGRYRRAAYDTKNWAIGNLCDALARHPMGIVWGWKEDPCQEFHKWVLYVELPTSNAQVSFHSAMRGPGPEYQGEWDWVKDAGAARICRWVAELLQEESGFGEWEGKGNFAAKKSDKSRAGAENTKMERQEMLL